MNNNIFSEDFKEEFFSNNFSKKYVYKESLIKNFSNIMSLNILNEILSIRSNWNNKNFIMMLNKKPIKYSDYSSLNLEVSGNILRPDVNKVQSWVSKGASIILNEIEQINSELINTVNQLQNITKGRCQGNLYFSMESNQAFGPHCDEHDVFAIHFEGEKVWNIYENIEKNPINHPLFKYNADERIKRAGKLINQVTLKPGDLLYLPRGQYHDALASKNGSIHIAFGLTYFKPIDLMSVIWEKLILNDFMREDIKINASKEELENTLKRLSKELESIIKTDETNEILSNCINNWPYDIKDYTLKKIISEGRRYKVSKSIKIEKIGKEAYLINGKERVNVPSNYLELTDYILKQESITYKSLSFQYKYLPENLIRECIHKLNIMQVIL